MITQISSAMCKWPSSEFMQFFWNSSSNYLWLTLVSLSNVKTFNKTTTLYSNSILYPIHGKVKLLLPQMHNFKFSVLLDIEYLNFLCKHNTLLTGTAEWVNLNAKFWQDNHTKACNQNSSFRDWQCSLTTKKGNLQKCQTGDLHPQTIQEKAVPCLLLQQHFIKCSNAHPFTETV